MEQTWANVIDPFLFIHLPENAKYNPMFRRRFDDKTSMPEEEIKEIKEDGFEVVVDMYYSMLVSDEKRNYFGSYAERRRIELDDILAEMLSDAWKEINTKPVCLKRHNMMHLIVIYCEFWGFVNKVIAEEHKEIGGYLSEEVIEVFDKYVTPFQDRIVHANATVDDFISLLEIRDKIVEFMQKLYRIRFPVEMKKIINPPETDYTASRYNPFDVDWLSAKVVEREAAMAFSAVEGSRMNEILAICERLDVMRSAYHPNDPEFKVLNDGCENAYEKYSKKNALEIGREILQQFIRMHDLLRMREPNNYVLYTLNEEANYWSYRMFLRQRKQELVKAMLTVNPKGKEHIAFQEMLSAMAVTEAILLITQKAFAPFVDQTYGVYGQYCPDKVSEQLWEVFQLEPFFMYPNPKITSILNKLRDATRLSLKKYYMNREHNLEKAMKKPMKRCELEGLSGGLGNISPKLVPFLHDLHWNSRIERFERRRILKEKGMAEDIKNYPFLPTVPKYSATFKDKHLMLFHSNYSDMLTENRAQRMPSRSYPKWKELKIQYEEWPKKTVDIIRSEVSRFLLTSVEIHRADVKCAVSSSLFAALIDHFCINEVHFGRIPEPTRARERLKTVLKVLNPLCNAVMKSDQIALKGDYKLMEQQFNRRHLRRIDYETWVPGDPIKPGSIPEAEYKEIAKEFLKCIEVYSDFFCVRV